MRKSCFLVLRKSTISLSLKEVVLAPELKKNAFEFHDAALNLPTHGLLRLGVDLAEGGSEGLGLGTFPLRPRLRSGAGREPAELLGSLPVMHSAAGHSAGASFEGSTPCMSHSALKEVTAPEGSPLRGGPSSYSGYLPKEGRQGSRIGYACEKWRQDCHRWLC